jgi:transcription elongation GreA/GreB family factor
MGGIITPGTLQNVCFISSRISASTNDRQSFRQADLVLPWRSAAEECRVSVLSTDARGLLKNVTVREVYFPTPLLETFIGCKVVSGVLHNEDPT